MDVLACLTVGRHVGVCADAACCNFRQLSLDIEHEGSELFDVDALALTELVLKICDQCSPDDLHLSRYLGNNGIKSTQKSHNSSQMLTYDLGSRGYWLGLVLSVGWLCLPG